MELLILGAFIVLLIAAYILIEYIIMYINVKEPTKQIIKKIKSGEIEIFELAGISNRGYTIKHRVLNHSTTVLVSEFRGKSHYNYDGTYKFMNDHERLALDIVIAPMLRERKNKLTQEREKELNDVLDSQRKSVIEDFRRLEK